MASIIIPSNKGLINPTINYAHPSSRNLTMLWWGGGEKGLTVDKRQYSISGETPSLTYYPTQGLWYNGDIANEPKELRGYSFSSGGILVDSNKSVITNKEFTIACISASLSMDATRIRTVFSQGSEIRLAFSMDTSLSALAGYITLWTNIGGSWKFLSRWSDSTTPQDGNPHFFVLGTGESAGSGYIYYQGVSKSMNQNQGLPAGSFSTTSQVRIGSSNNANQYHTEGLYMVATWNRRLPEEEVKYLSRDPYALLRGQFVSSKAFISLPNTRRRIYII